MGLILTQEELGKTRLTTDVRNKLAKRFKLFGMHRSIENLCKIKSEKKLLEEVGNTTESKCPPEIDKKSFAVGLYRHVKETKFKEENDKMLRDLYKAVTNFKKRGLDAVSLPPQVADFYNEVSDTRNYDVFSQFIYRGYKDKLEDLKEHCTSMKSVILANSGSGKTKTIKIDKGKPVGVVECVIPRNYNTFKKVVLDRWNNIDVIGKKKYAEGKAKLGLKEENEGDFDDIGRLATICQTTGNFKRNFTPLIKKVFEGGTISQIGTIHKYFKLNSKDIYSNVKDDLIMVIDLFYHDWEPRRREKVMDSEIAKMLDKKKRKKLGLNAIKSGTVKNLVNKFEQKSRNSSTSGSIDNDKDRQNKINTGAKNTVPELRKQFED